MKWEEENNFAIYFSLFYFLLLLLLDFASILLHLSDNFHHNRLHFSDIYVFIYFYILKEWQFSVFEEMKRELLRINGILFLLWFLAAFFFVQNLVSTWSHWPPPDISVLSQPLRFSSTILHLPKWFARVF